MNVIHPQARSYKRFVTAVEKIRLECALQNIAFADVRWLVAVRADGRFVPVVLYSSVGHAGVNLLPLVHNGITVVN